jgi:hypothetical protein
MRVDLLQHRASIAFQPQIEPIECRFGFDLIQRIEADRLPFLSANADGYQLDVAQDTGGRIRPLREA